MAAQNSTVPILELVVFLILAGACTPSEKSEHSGSDTDDDVGHGIPVVGELCDPVPHQSSNTCGDGIVGEQELCDDANDIDDDGCSNACQSTRGQHVENLFMPGARAIAGVPGPAPEQTTLVIGTDTASLVAVDLSGDVLWSTNLGDQGFAIQDIQVTDGGEFIVAGVDSSMVGGFDLWLARVDTQGQVVSALPSNPYRGALHGDTLLRADESLVVVGSRLIEDGLHDRAGAFAYDAALDFMWTAELWEGLEGPVEPAELSDGTIIVVADLVTYGDGFGELGLQLTALDSDGDELWAKSEDCSVDIGARVPALAALSDDTILVGLTRAEGNELLHYDQDTLMSRERWPEYSSYQQINADDQGGAWLVGDGDGSYVAYWHPDPARRWIGPTSGAAGVYDAWLEPGRRIWYTTSSGEVFAVSL